MGLQSEETFDSFFEQSEIEIDSQNEFPSPEKKIKKIRSSVPEIPQRSQEQVDLFRREEIQRYSNPQEFFSFTDENGESVLVTPACKTEVKNTKVREHFLLRTNRPSAVTLLSLIRDAASKMAQGQGTRAKICSLLRESQFVNKDISD